MAIVEKQTSSITSVGDTQFLRCIFMINDNPMPTGFRQGEPGHVMIMIASDSVYDIRSAFVIGPTYTQKRFCGGLRYKTHNFLTLGLW